MTSNLSPLRKTCHVTGSTCGTALGIGRHKSRNALKKEKLGTGTRKEESPFKQSILDYGNQYELVAINQAKFYYQDETMPLVHPAPFSYLISPEGGEDTRYGATPDGLIGDNAILEVKCPSTGTIYSELLEEIPYVPIDHFAQMYMEMACHQRSVGVYVCWTPKLVCYAHVYWDWEIWMDIYGGLLHFSKILEYDLDAKFKTGEKERVTKKFIDYSQRMTSVQFFEMHNKPTYK